MKMLIINVNCCLKILIKVFFLVFISFKLFSNDYSIKIEGNDYTDETAIKSLIKDQPTEISEKYSNYIIKTLDNSLLFKSVSVSIKENSYIITIEEYANVNKIYFENNDRFEDDELEEYSKELNLNNLNPLSIDKFKSEIMNLYQSLGYNNIKITHDMNLDAKTNTADLFFNIDEGTITKINNIFFVGNKNISSQELKSHIDSKTKNLLNIFANNNFKKFSVIEDSRKIKKLYSNRGFPDAKIDYTIEYLNSNKVNIYFDVFEGNLFSFKEINILDNENLLDENLKIIVNSLIKKMEYI